MIFLVSWRFRFDVFYLVSLFGCGMYFLFEGVFLGWVCFLVGFLWFFMVVDGLRVGLYAS